MRLGFRFQPLSERRERQESLLLLKRCNGCNAHWKLEVSNSFQKMAVVLVLDCLVKVRAIRDTRIGRHIAIKILKEEIKKLDDEMEEKIEKESDPVEKRNIRQYYSYDFIRRYDQIDLIKTNLFLSKNRNLNVSIPPRASESEYWIALEDFGEWVLTTEGFEYLDKKFHDARMRKNERFQSWFTPITAIIAIILSAIAILIQVPSKATPLGEEKNTPHFND